MSEHAAPELAGGVHIIGTGLLGTSVGLGLRRAGVDVRLSDVDPDAVRAAVEMGAGRPAVTSERAGLAVVAVPPGVAGEVAAAVLNDDLADYATDVASVKALPAAQVRVACTTPGRYVGSHPMAGREFSGPRAALPDLFEGRPWVLCPGPGTDPQAVVRTLAVARLCGALPVTMEVDAHDAAVARVSHAPHVVSALVAGLMVDAPTQQLRLAGPGVGDVTRIAASDPSLWSEILRVNAGAVGEVLRDLRGALDSVLVGLGRMSELNDGAAGADTDGPGKEVVAALHRGVDGRARLPGKHGARGVEYATVIVVVDDRPGQLATLFADAQRTGVNVEDVRIDHRIGQPVGAVELDVVAGHEDVLRQGLIERGWVVHV